MADSGTPFVDHYAAIWGFAGPETPIEELKKIYHEKLREYHPDKRPGSAGEYGPKMTRNLTEAWDVIRDPDKRKAYDVIWKAQKEAELLPHQRADLYRRRGNEVYSKARGMMRGNDALANFQAVQESLKQFRAAMDEYSKGIELAPYDHRLFSNRALCYLAVEDWPRCKDDAQTCVSLKTDFKKGWFLLAKALWKMGQKKEAQEQLNAGLGVVMDRGDLLDLQKEFNSEGMSYNERDFASRSVSPAMTPPSSRKPTPPPSHRSQDRPVSPQLISAGAQAARQSQTYGGPSSHSKSPGPASRHSPKLNLDASSTYQTGNFGAPTPCFASATPANVKDSFPSNVASMWPGTSGHRQSYSPGPAAGAKTYAGHSSRSPGPSSRSPGPSARDPGPTLGPEDTFGTTTGRSGSLGRKNFSLRGAAEASRSPIRK